MKPWMLVGLAAAGMTLWACGAPPEEGPLVELDHVLVVVPDPTAAVAALSAAGITVDTATVTRHEGNGTASVAALFGNAYLEIVWVDPDVAVSEEARGDLELRRQASAWSASGPSPFGIGLRRSRPGVEEFPFRGSERAVGEWVEGGEPFFIFETADDEPRAFVVPEYMGMSTWGGQIQAEMPSLFEHGLGVDELTSVTLHVSAVPASVEEARFDFVAFGEADRAPLLELEFDGGGTGEVTDLRPELPLASRR